MEVYANDTKARPVKNDSFAAQEGVLSVVARFSSITAAAGKQRTQKLENEEGNASPGRTEAPAPIGFYLLVMSIKENDSEDDAVWVPSSVPRSSESMKDAIWLQTWGSFSI